jgi:signal transduction histidine kinase/ligand-binding sensor domain-containing protein
VRLFFAVLSLLMAVAHPAFAQGDALSIAQFRHTAWKSSSAVPSNINQVIQFDDGYLWMASGDGLVRFDGVSFDMFSPATDDPTASYAVSKVLRTRSGELWVGRIGAGVSIFRDGRFIPVGMPNPSREVLELKQDLDGVIWVANARQTKALARFRQGQWEELDSRWGMPDGWIFSMLTARDGTLWISTMDNVVFLRRGSRRFEMTDVKVKGGGDLTEDALGQIWLADQAGVRRLPDYLAGQAKADGLPDYPAHVFRRRTRIAFAPDGSLWGASGTAGLFRITAPQARGVETTYGSKDGLTDDLMTHVFVDREGTVWAGGQRGLNAFVTPSVVDETAIPSGAGEYFISDDGRGSVYVSDGARLYLISPGQPPRLIRHDLTGAVGLCGGDGRIWLVHAQRVEEIREGRTVRSFAANQFTRPSLCVKGGGDTLWVSDGEKIALHDQTGWREVKGLPAGGDKEIFIDRQQRLFISLDHTSLTRIEGEATRSWTAAQLQLGRLSSVHDGAAGLIVAGVAGLARLGEGRIEHIAARRHPWLRGVRYMVETPEGDVWLFTYTSIVRVSIADLNRGFDHPDQPISHRVFDELDGMSSGSERYEGPRAARGGDGRLWFLGGVGVMRVTPGELTHNPLPPPIVIRAVTAGGRLVSAMSAIRLPVGRPSLQIDYAALSLRVPSRVRFRYRLEGLDKAWVEAGSRRTAFYNNLPPGQYRFIVLGANDEGVWNNVGAALDVTVPPTFWQTRWFMAMGLLAFMVAIWFAYRVRLAIVTDRIRSRMNDRIAERERIARELHDTLLQGVQGLILRIQLIVEDLPRGQPQRIPLEQALDAADEVLGEARDRVLDLRATERTEDLEARLGKLVRDQGPVLGASVGVFVGGTPRELDEIAGDEVMRIVGEALANARSHAKAGCIEIRVKFGVRRLIVSIVDDGEGISPDILREGGRPGHFGLAGMRERARALSGRLSVDTPPGGGTGVTVTIPARVAYVPRPLLSWRKLLSGKLWHG